MKVVIASGSLLWRAGLLQLLSGSGHEVVAEACDGRELLRKVRGHRPDVAVIDAGEGLGAARALRAELPAVGLLLLAPRAAALPVAELKELGPAGVGYLFTDRVERLGDAIAEVARGGSLLDPAVVEALFARRQEDALGALTPREREVLAAMAVGESNRGIARRLYVSERVVERHITAIFAKLSVRASENAHRRVLAVLTYLQA